MADPADVDLRSVLEYLNTTKNTASFSATFATEPQILFFVQGKNEDDWVIPQEPSFANALLASLVDFYNANQSNEMYHKRVIHNKFSVETRGGPPDTYNVIIFGRLEGLGFLERRPAQEILKVRRYPMMMLVTENDKTLHRVIPCVFNLPQHSGAPGRRDLLTEDALQGTDSKTLMLQMNMKQKFPGAETKTKPKYVERILRDREVMLQQATTTTNIRHISYILQGSDPGTWVVGRTLGDEVVSVAKKTEELYRKDETWAARAMQYLGAGENINVANMAGFQKEKIYDPQTQLYLIPNGTIYRNAPLMFLREVTKDARGLDRVTNRVLLYCRTPIPSHRGYAHGADVDFIADVLINNPQATVETWAVEDQENLMVQMIRTTKVGLKE